ncbi:MAG TPA: hypothetical protein DCY86_10310, partial [Bdellovibrionales bacterium]|nr:hypothetical protein [Bdellovibrionales bacterium]
MLSIGPKKITCAEKMSIKILIIFFVIIVTAFGCAKEGSISIGGKGDSASTGNSSGSAVSVSSVQVVNERFIIRGTNLKNVKSAKITGPSGTNKTFVIESQTNDQLVAFIGALPSLQIIAESTYQLLMNTADAQTVYPIVFTIPVGGVTNSKIAPGAVTGDKIANGTVTLNKISGTGANDGDVIKWDSANQLWYPAPDESGGGGGGGGGISAISLGNGIVGSGGTILTTGMISVNTGTGAGQIQALDSSGDLELIKNLKINSTGALKFPHTSREFRIYNDGTLRFFELGQGDRMTIDGDGDVTIPGDVQVGGGFAIGTQNFPTADGSSGQFLKTNGGGVLTWADISGSAVTSISATAPIAVTGVATAPVISINDSGVVSGTYTKVAVSSKGLVTSAGVLTASDMPTSIDATRIATGVVDNAEFIYLDGVTSAIQTQLNNKQPLDADLTQIAGLTPTDNYFLVGNGANWTAEDPATARGSMGLGTMAVQNSNSVAISGGAITGGAISGVTINNSVIGGTTPVAGTFTTATATSVVAGTVKSDIG